MSAADRGVIKPRPFCRWIGGLALLALIAACGSGTSDTKVSLPPDPVFPGIQAYRTQLHMHGHSNHNASGRYIGSMQWHAAQALVTDSADVLWWTEHTGLFDLSQDFTMNMAQRPGRISEDGLSVEGLQAGPVSLTKLVARSTGGMPTAQLGVGVLETSLATDAQDQDWQTLT